MSVRWPRRRGAGGPFGRGVSSLPARRIRERGIGGAALWAAGLWLWGGCAGWGGVPASALPETPIAIQYRTPEEARRRVEATTPRVESAPRTPTVGSKARLTADVDRLGAYLAERLGAAGAEGDRGGRLALLDPQSGAIEIVESARRGAVPQAWDSDHRRLLFAQPEPGGPNVQIFEFDRVDRSVRPITHGPGLHTQACYLADGRIAVTRVDVDRDPPRSRVRVSAPGGRGPYRDLSSGERDHSPSCAGDRVAFVRVEERGSALYRVDLAGNEQRLGPGHQPRWVGGGPWIVYTGLRSGATALYRVRGDGRGRARIGPGSRGEAWPTASSDGRFVAYVAGDASGRHRLYLRRFDGGGDRILFADGDADYPVW